MPRKPAGKYPPEKVGAKRSHLGGSKQKYFLSPEGRKLMMEQYDSSTKKIDELATRLNVPRHMIKIWAVKLGLTSKARDNRWTEEDLRFLKQNIYTMPVTEISKRLKKSSNAIRERAIKLGYYRKKGESGYSLNDVMIGFGLSNNRKIYRWIEDGWLKGTKKRTEVSNKLWNFTDKNIRDFILAHPGELDPCKFDWLWIADILAEDGLGRLDEDKYTRSEGEE